MEKGLILVGAGPGDPELLTIKGLKAIEKAEVILYDALVSEQILAYAAGHCKKIFVGKRAGMHSMAQHGINSLIGKYAKDHLVIRLKGGDPFVFGRGFEELTAAMAEGIAVEVIPGITSAISGPASVGIPLTTRGMSRSFWVVTATSADGQLTHDLKFAAQSSATIVILMGTKKLATIAGLIRSTRGADEPMAVVQNATCPNEKLITGTAGEILSKFHASGTEGPGIIVVGKVVEESKYARELAQKLKEMELAA